MPPCICTAFCDTKRPPARRRPSPSRCLRARSASSGSSTDHRGQHRHAAALLHAPSACPPSRCCSDLVLADRLAELHPRLAGIPASSSCIVSIAPTASAAVAAMPASIDALDDRQRLAGLAEHVRIGHRHPRKRRCRRRACRRASGSRAARRLAPSASTRNRAMPSASSRSPAVRALTISLSALSPCNTTAFGAIEHASREPFRLAVVTTSVRS